MLEEIKKIIDYNPDTGIFIWKQSRGGTAVKGSKAGTRHTKGYVELNVFGKRWLAHRLAWELIYGPIPVNLHIDHIDRDKTNNKISNLRLCNASESVANRNGYSSKGLPKGIEQTGSGKYMCRIAIYGVRYSGIVRNTVEEALQDYDRLSARHQKEFAVARS